MEQVAPDRDRRRARVGRFRSGPMAQRRRRAAIVLAVLAGAVLALNLLAGMPWGLAWLAIINPLTMGAYALDKYRSIHGGRRLPERGLLGLALVGGTPGAALAMALVRHKTRKDSFRNAFAAIIAAQVLLLVLWLSLR